MEPRYGGDGWPMIENHGQKCGISNMQRGGNEKNSSVSQKISWGHIYGECIGEQGVWSRTIASVKFIMDRMPRLEKILGNNYPHLGHGGNF